MEFTPSGKLFLTGAVGSIMSTPNNGASWSITHTINGSKTPFTNIRMVDDLYGYAVGTSGKVVKTTDGGATWVPLSIGTGVGSSLTLLGLDFIGRDTGYTCSPSGLVRKTTNGGSRMHHVYSIH